ncbi:hypothetical protein ACWEFJ_24525 [Actinosynnema sp. NPDC004786]
MNGTSPVAYSADLAANAAGMTAAALIAARLAGRVAAREVIADGKAVALSARPSGSGWRPRADRYPEAACQSAWNCAGESWSSASCPHICGHWNRFDGRFR